MPHYDSQTLIVPGWMVGAGVEHMLAANWLVRLEYRYADFGQINPTFFTYNSAPAATIASSPTSASTPTQSIWE